MTIRLLTRTEIRNIARELDFRPRKALGQNFVHDANTLRRIVSSSGINKSDHVLEVGPGMGSLTLALLDRGAKVTAVDRAARRLSLTVKGKEIEEEREAVKEFGTADSGASLGDILGAAIRRRREMAGEE